MGGSVLGASIWVRGIHEVQEAHERAEIWSESDSEPAIHALVVANNQQGKCERFFELWPELTVGIHSIHVVFDGSDLLTRFPKREYR